MRTPVIIASLLLAAGAPGALAQDETTDPRPNRPAPQPAPQPADGVRQPETVSKAHSPDAVAALKFAAAAIKDGFTANVRTYATGNALLESTFPKGEGNWAQKGLVEVEGEAEGEPGWMVRYTGSGNVMTRNEPVDFDILWQPDRTTWLDHTAQTYNADRPTGRKSGEAYMLASSAWTQVEDLAKGFTDALEAAVLEIREGAEVDGVACDVVAVTARPGGDAILWYFGHEDHLPRRSEIVLPASDLSGAIRADFTDVAAGAEAIADVTWEIAVPEGYTKNIARALEQREARTAPAATNRNDNSLPEPAGLPDWEVPDSEGKLVSPGSLRDQISVLYFWGTWSPVCKRALPDLTSLAADYKDKPVEVISMAFREGTPEGVVNAAREQGQTWRQVPQADDVVRMMGIRVAPSFVVLGKEGELLYRSARPRGDDYETMFTEIRQIIDRALEAAPGEAGGRSDEPGARGPGDRVSPGGATPSPAGKPAMKPPTKTGG